MKNKIYEIYNQEIENIINDKNILAVFLVGSVKYKDLNLETSKINDIDIFVVSNQTENQIRIIKKIDELEFDINYFSENGVKYFINKKEYFFLKEMKNPEIIYDKKGIGLSIIDLCKYKYKEGPDKLSQEEKELLKSEIQLKIQSLKLKEEYENYEYEFLTNLYLKDIIVGYFTINNKWIPKDKKIIKELREEDEELFNLVENIQKYYEYQDLLNVYNYVFENIDITKSIKITY
ncbi:MAG: hypothetical protein RSD47_08015 [Romboutsia sp.]